MQTKLDQIKQDLGGIRIIQDKTIENQYVNQPGIMVVDKKSFEHEPNRNWENSSEDTQIKNHLLLEETLAQNILKESNPNNQQFILNEKEALMVYYRIYNILAIDFTKDATPQGLLNLMNTFEGEINRLKPAIEIEQKFAKLKTDAQEQLLQAYYQQLSLSSIHKYEFPELQEKLLQFAELYPNVKIVAHSKRMKQSLSAGDISKMIDEFYKKEANSMAPEFKEYLDALSGADKNLTSEEKMYKFYSAQQFYQPNDKDLRSLSDKIIPLMQQELLQLKNQALLKIEEQLETESDIEDTL